MFDLLKVEFPGETSLTKMGIVATLEDNRNVVVLAMRKGQYLPLLLPSRLWSNDMNLYKTAEKGKVTRGEMVTFFEKVMESVGPSRGRAMNTELSRMRKAFDLIDTDSSTTLR